MDVASTEAPYLKKGSYRRGWSNHCSSGVELWVVALSVLRRDSMHRCGQSNAIYFFSTEVLCTHGQSLSKQCSRGLSCPACAPIMEYLVYRDGIFKSAEEGCANGEAAQAYKYQY